MGVEEAELKTALGEIRADQKSATREAKPSEQPTEAEREAEPEARQAEFAKALTEKLGIAEAAVTEALESAASERSAESAEKLKTKLDQAVTDGKLTQAEADAVSKAVETGVIGGMGR